MPKRRSDPKGRVVEQRPPLPKPKPVPLYLAFARDSITR
jgi:hypothetical protein